MEGGWEWSPAFWHHAVFCTLFSCSCLLSIHSTIQSSNISVATCLWHFWFEEWGALLLLRLFSWFQNHFAHSTFFLSFMFLLCISAMHMSALVLNWFILFWILIFLLIVMALVYCFSFASQQTASLTLTCWHYCHYLNDSTASLLLFLVPIIVVISHRFWLDLTTLCLSGATLLFAWFHFPLFSLFQHCFLLYEPFINIYALFVIHLIIT